MAGRSVLVGDECDNILCEAGGDNHRCIIFAGFHAVAGLCFVGKLPVKVFIAVQTFNDTLPHIDADAFHLVSGVLAGDSYRRFPVLP